MGKSTASCFKIIACGSDSVDHGDLQTPESKVSSARSGWSFRKRSARHQVLSNTIISEAPFFTESPEATVANLQVQPNLSVPAKESVIQCTDEKYRLSAQVDSNLSDIIATEDEERSVDATPKESSVILIQAAIRGYLARRMLLKQKNVIKLQAAIRGHLVRRHAVGTLRCVLAIIKMQALIRARHIRLKGSGDFEKKKKKISVVDGLNPTVLRSKTEAKENGTDTYITIEKLLGNKFARQLMESTPRTKPINIKCDPAKSDSAWKWLERWVSVSPVNNEEQDKSGSAPVLHEMESLGCEPKDYENLITRDADNLDIDASSDPPLTIHPKLQNVEMMETGLIENMDAKPVLVKYETKNQQVLHESKEFSFVQPETERKRFPQKASNPSFIAAHSKFEELSSASTGPPFKSGEIGLNNASLSNAVSIQVAGSECGTELSVTSTLDSPDMSDGGVYDLELEPKMLDASDPPRSREKLEHEAFENSSILGTELSYANIDHLERNETIHPSAGEHINSVIASESPPHEKKLESDQSNKQQVKPESDAIHIVDKSLPKVSPRSHVTLPKSQAMLSSQVSVSPKKSNGGKVNSNEKKKSLSADKSLVSTPNRDSPTQSSLKPPEEPKSGKRRKSFGSTKLEFTDQEPREAGSQNSLPSYMQPTKSARAKALSSGSLKSSPDAQDKDIFLKNRPYHPGRNEREGSPRIQHSPSQAQQTAKGNDTHSPQGRKWLR
ncbi:protein IQ-DOMAIN 32-like [Salvia divinorum]|uniref:Protein IQ-DOMAIN 32-like n=1 Tax=Salvia divinorum TaxID=28513 RepID=A0ABD1FSH8_SALDI